MRRAPLLEPRSAVSLGVNGVTEEEQRKAPLLRYCHLHIYTLGECILQRGGRAKPRSHRCNTVDDSAARPDIIAMRVPNACRVRIVANFLLGNLELVGSIAYRASDEGEDPGNSLRDPHVYGPAARTIRLQRAQAHRG